nr:primosomal protein N' [Lachnospiraceae bacterium]
MPLYADIIVNISVSSLDRTFQYLVPEEMADTIRPGSRVDIPFGTRTVSGYVVGLGDTPLLEPAKIKPILGYAPKGVALEDRAMALAAWMRERYGCTMNQALATVLPAKKAVRKGRAKLPAPAWEGLEMLPPAPLNDAQTRVAQGIEEELAGRNRPVLLHGITGSGKTEVYMAVMEKVMAAGKQVILLIPEISLTYQNVRRFYQRFGDRIGLIHSRQSQGEKYETVEKARKGELSLVIGPRSALFTPFPDLGLIVIDEEHDDSYFSETSPRYHSVEVAEKLAHLCGAGLILGSATPSLDSYYQTQTGAYRLEKLEARAVENSTLPRVEVVDLRREMKEGNKSIFSRSLKSKMEERLAKKEQIILFLNRRGFAGFVSCRSCGKPLICPHCDVSLTLHRGAQLKCHYCGYQIPAPQNCPSCGSPYIAAFGTGTQKVEGLIEKTFPGAKVLRMDADTTKGKEGHSRILSAFARGGADILLGTQMIVKGHDFPKVSLVGILAADISLYREDYRAAEQTFELLTQAAGRAGRAGLPGEVVIQTYQPDHYAVEAAARQDYEAFYREEIVRRQLLHYPPSGGMLEVLVSGLEEAENTALAESLAEDVRRRYGPSGADVIGPAPHFRGKVQDVYRQVLLIKHPDRALLLQIAARLREEGNTRVQSDLH